MSNNMVEFFAKDFPGFAETGYYLQVTLGRELMHIEHFHGFYEFICVASGECGQLVNGVLRTASTGDLVMMRPGDSHTFTCQKEKTNIIAFSILVPEFDKFRIAYGLQETGEPVFRHLSPDELERLCGMAMRGWELSQNERLPIMRVLLGILLSSIIAPERRTELPERFQKVVDAMNEPENFREGVSAFLRLSNFSHPQLCRLTKKWLKMTPNEYVVSLRMKYAYRYVTGSDMSIESIAESVGFSSYSHFSKVFCESFGVSPGEARRNAARTV